MAEAAFGRRDRAFQRRRLPVRSPPSGKPKRWPSVGRFLQTTLFGHGFDEGKGKQAGRRRQPPLPPKATSPNSNAPTPGRPERGCGAWWRDARLHRTAVRAPLPHRAGALHARRRGHRDQAWDCSWSLHWVNARRYGAGSLFLSCAAAYPTRYASGSSRFLAKYPALPRFPPRSRPRKNGAG